MTLQFIAILLTVQLISAVNIDVDEFSSFDTLSYNGFKTPIFNVNGVVIAKPVVTMEQSCPTISYNYLLHSYQMSLSIKVDQNPLETAEETNFDEGKPGHFKITKMHVVTINQDEEISTSVISNTSSNHKLVFKCDKSDKCNKVSFFITTKSDEFQDGLKFKIIGKVQEDNWIFKRIRIARLHKTHCRFDGWIVFHRRVDGSLSFAQNWDTYVKGFGDPKGNYWMGLEQLHSLTVKKSQQNYKCKMRMELEDWHGKTYWGQWNLFQVMGAEDKYRLKVGEVVQGTQMNMFTHHNNSQFSTYDRDYDPWAYSSCSIDQGGRGGWWFGYCMDINIHGAYSSPSSPNGWDTGLNTANLKDAYIPIKKSVMKLDCN